MIANVCDGGDEDPPRNPLEKSHTTSRNSK